MLDAEAILYYADHPVEFTEDVIRARPDPEQAKILRSVAANCRLLAALSTRLTNWIFASVIS